MQRQSSPTRIAGLSDIDPAKLLAVCLERKWVIAAFTTLFFLIGVVVLHFTPPMYTAQLQVAPTQGSGDAGSKLGGLSSLAATVGVNLPQDQGSGLYRLYLAGINSRSTADAMAKRSDVMSVLYNREWNDDTHAWHAPERGVVGFGVWAAKSVLGLRIDPWLPPDGSRLQEYISKHVVIDQDPKKPLATISYSNSNPRFAVLFLGALHSAVDDQLRLRSIKRSQQYISYLSDRLPAVTNTEHREAVADILSNQEKMMMMTSAAGAYAAEPFGPPSVGDLPTSPIASQFLMVFTVIGIVVGVLFAILQALGWIGCPFSRRRPPVADGFGAE